MLRQLGDHAEGNCGDVGAERGRLQDVNGVAHAGHDDLRRKPVVVEDAEDLLHQLHAVVGDVVEPAHEGAHVGRACLGRHQGLDRRKDERLVHVDSVAGEDLRRLEPLRRHRHLDDDVAAQPDERLRLGHHARRVQADHLEAHGTGHRIQDLPDHVVERPLLPGHQARVRRHAVAHAEAQRLPDIADIGRIDEELHEASRSLKSLWMIPSEATGLQSAGFSRGDVRPCPGISCNILRCRNKAFFLPP